MATREQVAYHNEQAQLAASEAARREAEARAQAAGIQTEAERVAARRQAERDALQSQYQAQQMNQQGAIQGGLAAQAAGFQANRDASLAGYQQEQRRQDTVWQGQLNQQGAYLGQQRDILQTDLAGRLNQIKLNQDDEMLVRNLDRARSRIRNDPNLSPEERENLITQIETKLNPLENRQRQAQTIQSQLQSQALYQGTQQQAHLFNVQQEQRLNGVQFRTATINGMEMTYYMNAQGGMEFVDTSRAAEAHQMRMLEGGAGVANTVQSIQQRQAEAPVRLTGLQLANMSTEQQINFLANRNPMELQQMGVNIERDIEALQHATQMNPVLRRQSIANLERTRQQIDQANEEFPIHLRQLSANTGIAEETLAQQPERFAAWRRLTNLNEQIAKGQISGQELDQIYSGLRIDDMRGQLAHNPLIRKLEILRTQGQISGNEYQNTRSWLENNLLIMGIEEGFGGAGSNNRSRMTPDQINDNARQAVAAAERARQEAGQPPMTEAQRTAALRTEEARLTAANQNQGMTPAQARRLSERLRNAPPAILRNLGITLAPQGENPPPANNPAPAGQPAGQPAAPAAPPAQRPRQSALAIPTDMANQSGMNRIPSDVREGAIPDFDAILSRVDEARYGGSFFQLSADAQGARNTVIEAVTVAQGILARYPQGTPMSQTDLRAYYGALNRMYGRLHGW